MLPWAWQARASTSIPVGLELYSVRNELKRDPEATVRAVGQMGYQCVEFYAPYFERTDAQTKDMRRLLDGLGVRCYSTHNELNYLNRENLQRTRDLNLTLGSKYVVVASAQPKPGLDGWRELADTLNAAAEQLEPAGLKVGYHNHQPEFMPVEGKRPLEILAGHTKPSVLLQLDVGTCLAAGSDPVAWIRANPGRNSLHPLQGLVPRAGQRLHRVIWRRRSGLEGHFRCCGKRRWCGVLPGRAGRQPIPRA